MIRIRKRPNLRMAMHAAAALALACGAAWAQAAPSDEPGSNPEMQALLSASSSGTPQAPAISYVREQALRSAAKTLGLQLGEAQRARQILALLHAQSARLDAAFAFNRLMMGVGVLPPVIVETRDAVSLDASVMHVADRTYTIIAPPRFVAMPPTWRSYLELGLSTQDPVIPTSDPRYPKDAAERAYWKKEVQSAYAEGVATANSIFSLNLALLKRDYSGMRTFYELYARHMVTAPVIAGSHQIIRRDGKSIAVGDAVFRITAQPDFVSKTSDWTAIAPLDRASAASGAKAEAGK